MRLRLTVQYGSVIVHDHERRALVTVPPGRKKHTAILFLAGSGCASPESPQATDPSVRILGYVTMRVEKTGMGDSTGPACYSSEAGDVVREVEGYYRAGYAALAQHPSVT